MTQSKIIVHIGNPKAYSTYLQSLFAEQESSNKIVYSGFRPNTDFRRWYQSDTESHIYNNALRYQSKFHFRRSFSNFQKFVNGKIEQGVLLDRTVIFSSENIIMRGLPNELDVEDKLQRLESLIPQPKKLTCVFRGIKESIYSMYKEYVNHGYTGSWALFLRELYLLRENNFVDAFLPHVVHQQITENINGEVQFVYTDNSPSTEMFSAFSIEDSLKAHINNVNKGFNMWEAESIARQNLSNSIEVGLAGMSELHRLFWHEVSSNNNVDEFFWLKRRKVKSNIEAGIQNAAHNYEQSEGGLNDHSLAEFEHTFYSSELIKYLHDMSIECEQYFKQVSPTNLCQTGEPSVIWRGIMEN